MGLGKDHKVLVVLDHGPRFARCAGNPLSITLKEASVNRTVGKCDKSLWTWCVEATLELHRTVSDLFSGERDPCAARLMRLVLADYVGRVLQPEWGTQLVTQQEMLSSLSAIGLPSANDDGESLVLSGVTLAIEALSQLSEAQMKDHRAETPKEAAVAEKRTSFTRVPKCWERCSAATASSDQEKKPVENCGSIVIFTSFTEEAQVEELENEVADMINSRNRIIKSLQDNAFSCISNVRLYILNVVPAGQQSNVVSKSYKVVSPTMSSCVLSRSTGVDLISGIHSAAIDIYDLVSTTVSGIPMKEEAQQGQSAVAINYDVELLHRREAHAELDRLSLIAGNVGKLTVLSANATYPTARLVWATPVPKGRWNMFPHVRHASRVTPSAVNSRPSVCLSSYLLQGRNVMLEIMYQEAKHTAHTLIAHGGHIYIHANDLGKHSLLDSKEVRENVKLKKAENARIDDFISLIKETTLRVPDDPDKKPSTSPSDLLCTQPRRQLLRITRYWPIRSDHSLIYNVPKRFEAFFAILRQQQLSSSDIDKCKQVIYQLVNLKESKERLFEGDINTRVMKDPCSREEQLQVCFVEFAQHLANYANHSDKHAEIFHLFVQSAGMERAVRVPAPDVTVLDRTGSKRQDSACTGLAVTSASVTSTITSELRNTNRSDSPLPKKPRKACYLWKPNETLNLYDYLMEKEERHHRAHWVDFVGRVKAGNRPAHLYPNLDASATVAKQD
ncbi:hypothetical protein Q1695_006210 [Nippostrongylus brasiliensis]|nr:hypothetical protein Q1695_006210 [Nippostrongylus brasiliensis]